MSLSPKCAAKPTSDAQQVAVFLHRLFGNREGIVAIGLGVGGRYNEHNKYTFRRMEHKYFMWPQRRQDIIDLALRSAKRHDVYIIPNLLSARSAKKGHSLGSVYCRADIDDVNDATMARLNSLLGEGSFIVQTGRGLHVYIRLNGFYPPEVVVDLSKRLFYFLPADSKWPDNALLRLPGCFNHKGRSRGGESFGVVIKDVMDTGIAPWTPDALGELLGPLPDDAAMGSTKRTSKANDPLKLGGQATAGKPVSIVPVNAEPVPSDLPDEICRLLRPRRTRGRLTDQSRSAQLHRLVEMCMSYGYRDGEVMGIAMTHEPAHEKWPNNVRRSREVQRCIGKLRPRHPHVGRTCSESGCSPHTTPEVIARIEEIRQHFDAIYKCRTAATDSKILDALCQRALEIGRLEVGVSQRRLMELASIGNINTLLKGLDRLSAAGYVKKSLHPNGNPRLSGKGNRRIRAHSYMLTTPNHEAKYPELGERSPGMDKGVALIHRCGEKGSGKGALTDEPAFVSLLDPALDMWRYAGLSSARLTYGELLGGTTDVGVIAANLDHDPRTIRRHLTALESVGLAQRKPNGAWVAFERDPDDVAIELGTFAMGALQADRHAWESERFRGYLVVHDEEERRAIQALLDRESQPVGAP